MAFLVSSSIISTVSANKKTSNFSDVSSRYAESVNYLVDYKISKGVSETQYGIDQQIKRGDAAIILANALGLPTEGTSDSGFTDVPKRGVAAINALKKAGIVDGKSSKHFGFDDLLKRGEIALMLTKSSAYNLKGNKDNVKFTDVNVRYSEAVAGLIDNKLTNGISATSFGTDDNLKRGEYAIFIYKAEMIKKESSADKIAPQLIYSGEKELKVGFNEIFEMPIVTATDNVDKT